MTQLEQSLYLGEIKAILLHSDSDCVRIQPPICHSPKACSDVLICPFFLCCKAVLLDIFTCTSHLILTAFTNISFSLMSPYIFLSIRRLIPLKGFSSDPESKSLNLRWQQVAPMFCVFWTSFLVENNKCCIPKQLLICSN